MMSQSAIRNPKPVLSQVEVSEMEVLEQRARALAQRPTEEVAEEETLRLVTFSLGGERYGLDITLVQEVQPLKPQTWSRVPCTPDFIVGAVNLRGRLYSVTDIGRLLGLSSRPLSETAHVLLVQGGSLGGEGAVELSILTDDMPEVAVVPLAEVQPPSATVSAEAQEFVRGVTEDMLIILKLERLLSHPGIFVNEEVGA
jgi:purine-binding chemotaxis protein CheW